MSRGVLKIGEVAARAGVGPKTIRFYESHGVLARPARGENDYRLYSPETVDVLRFVKQAQGLGLTLDEIKEIVAIRQGGRPPCAHVHALLKQKAEELDRKLDDLLRLRTRIRRSLVAWGRMAGRNATVCPHIEEQATTGSSRRKAPS